MPVVESKPLKALKAKRLGMIPGMTTAAATFQAIRARLPVPSHQQRAGPERNPRPRRGPPDAGRHAAPACRDLPVQEMSSPTPAAGCRPERAKVDLKRTWRGA